MNYIDNRCKYSCWVRGFDCCWVCWAFLTSSRHHNLEGRCWQFKQLINIQLCKTRRGSLQAGYTPHVQKADPMKTGQWSCLTLHFIFLGSGLLVVCEPCPALLPPPPRQPWSTGDLGDVQPFPHRLSSAAPLPNILFIYWKTISKLPNAPGISNAKLFSTQSARKRPYNHKLVDDYLADLWSRFCCKATW